MTTTVPTRSPIVCSSNRAHGAAFLGLLALTGTVACAPPTFMDTSIDQVPNANRGVVATADEASAPDLSLNALVDNFIAAGSAMGCAVGITEYGEIAYLQGYGLADPQTPFTVATRSAIGSISKILTAVAAMRLVEMGELALDDRFTEVVNHGPLPATYANATLEDLLSHRSQVKYWPDWLDGDEATTRALLNFVHGPEDESGALPRKAVLGLDDQMPSVAAGTYSNLGYLMVAAMIDAVVQDPGFSGYPDDASIERGYESYVWSLLNQSGTRMWSSALNHPWREDGDLEVFATDPAWPAWSYFGWESGAGGWTMTIGDLARLTTIMRGQEILEGDTWDDMTTSRGNLNLGIASPMGLGVILRDRAGGETAMGHDGGIYGYQASVYYLPEHELGVAVMCNNATGSVPGLADDIGDHWIGGGGGIGGLGGFGRSLPTHTAARGSSDRLVEHPRGPGAGMPTKVVHRTPVPSANVERVDPATQKLRAAWSDGIEAYLQSSIERYGPGKARRQISDLLARYPEGRGLLRAIDAGNEAEAAACFLSLVGDDEPRSRCPAK